MPPCRPIYLLCCCYWLAFFENVLELFLLTSSPRCISPRLSACSSPNNRSRSLMEMNYIFFMEDCSIFVLYIVRSVLHFQSCNTTVLIFFSSESFHKPGHVSGWKNNYLFCPLIELWFPPSLDTHTPGNKNQVVIIIDLCTSTVRYIVKIRLTCPSSDMWFACQFLAIAMLMTVLLVVVHFNES